MFGHAIEALICNNTRRSLQMGRPYIVAKCRQKQQFTRILPDEGTCYQFFCKSDKHVRLVRWLEGMKNASVTPKHKCTHTNTRPFAFKQGSTLVSSHHQQLNPYNFEWTLIFTFLLCVESSKYETLSLRHHWFQTLQSVKK